MLGHILGILFTVSMIIVMVQLFIEAIGRNK